MKFSYRGYTHPDNEVDLAAFMVRPRFSARHRRISSIYQMHLRGQLIINDPSIVTPDQLQAAMATKIAKIVDVYAYDDGDAIFRHDNGTPTRHSLISANSITGVKVRHRSWPRGGMDEYATIRTFYIVLEAEFLEPDAQLLYFFEALRFIGTGGPRIVVEDTFDGPPIYQLTNLYTHQKVVQWGSAVGLNGWPLLDVVPLYPDYEHLDRREITPTSADSFTNGYMNYPVQWTFHFSLPTGTIGFPHLR